MFAALEADLELVVRYRGGTLDRLLDERDAATVAAVVGALRARGWTTAVEVTFYHYGDLGSIDALAVHPVARIALVVEVKTEITSAEETLRRLDVKVRLGAGLAWERFRLPVTRVVPLLAVLDSTANRSRVVRLAPLLDPAFPNRSAALSQWLANPGQLAAASSSSGFRAASVVVLICRDRTGSDGAMYPTRAVLEHESRANAGPAAGAGIAMRT